MERKLFWKGVILASIVSPWRRGLLIDSQRVLFAVSLSYHMHMCFASASDRLLRLSS